MDALDTNTNIINQDQDEEQVVNEPPAIIETILPTIVFDEYVQKDMTSGVHTVIQVSDYDLDKAFAIFSKIKLCDFKK